MPRTQYSGTSAVGYLYDDFADNELVHRDRTIRSDAPHAYRAFRPIWITFRGSPAAQNGQLEFPASTGDEIVVRTLPAADNADLFDKTTTWEIDIQAGSSLPSGAFIAWRISKQTTDNMIWLELTDSQVAIQKMDGGSKTTLVSASVSPGTSTNTIRATRTGGGNWELFWNGTSQGTATDPFVPNAVEQRVRASADSTQVIIPQIRIS